MKKDLTSITDLSREQFLDLLARARELKRTVAQKRNLGMAEGRVAALIFEKPSLRTRVTFEVAMRQLGGYSVYLGPQEVGLGVRETVPDVARNLSRWVDCIIARVFEHEKVTGLAEYSTRPVINALSDLEHPCQILADFLTIEEHHGRLEGVVLAWTGDGNNVCNSLLLACGLLGVGIRVATPRGFEPPLQITDKAQGYASKSGAEITLTHDPVEAVKGVHFVYTDTWASMGQEDQAEQRRKIFRPYQVNGELLKVAGPDAKVMHCLPAHRGEEITDEVLDGARSVVLDQAENRLHVQRALLASLLNRNQNDD